MAGLLVGVDRVVDVLRDPVLRTAIITRRPLNSRVSRNGLSSIPRSQPWCFVRLAGETGVDDLFAVVHELFTPLDVEALNGGDVQEVVVVDVVTDGPDKA